MPYIKYLLSAEYITQDNFNKPIIAGVFDKVFKTESGKQEIIFSFGIASRIGDFKEGKKITVKVFGPGKFEKESSITIPEGIEDIELNTLFRFELIQIKDVGRYEIKMFLDGNEIKTSQSYYFDVV